MADGPPFGSRLTTIIVSVSCVLRPGRASTPTSRMLTRSSLSGCWEGTGSTLKPGIDDWPCAPPSRDTAPSVSIALAA